jgi:uncharacterized membrane protein YphA (DoxX/SURF4 family)
MSARWTIVSAFPAGQAGAGLIVLRTAAMIGYGTLGVSALSTRGPTDAILGAVIVSGAMLLALGLWTRRVALVLGGTQVSFELVHRQVFATAGRDPRALTTFVLLISLAIGLALVGPGAFSIDARRFGWRRIAIKRPTDRS